MLKKRKYIRVLKSIVVKDFESEMLFNLFVLIALGALLQQNEFAKAENRSEWYVRESKKKMLLKFFLEKV